MSDEVRTDGRRGPRGVAVSPSPEPTKAPQLDSFGAMPNQTPASALGVPSLDKPVPEEGDEVRIVHFVADGLSALGRVFYHGEELELVVGSDEWEGTCDPRSGRSFLDYDEDEQISRWGERKFREGPWRGMGYDAATFPDTSTAPTKEELAAIEVQRRRKAAAGGGMTFRPSNRR